MDIDRCGVKMAFDLDAVEYRLRKGRIPVLLDGDGVDVIQQTLVDQVMEIVWRY